MVKCLLGWTITKFGKKIVLVLIYLQKLITTKKKTQSKHRLNKKLMSAILRVITY